jgi:hypothetical protein
MYDLYRSKRDESLRIVTLPGAGFQNHFDARAWELIPPGDASAEKVRKDTAKEVEARGFCFYRLAEPSDITAKRSTGNGRLTATQP